ncbi:MAG: thioredoxin [archaeon]|nr:thioredoxin [archaeon]
MGSVTELKEANFDDFISEGKVIVDFWAEWCGPCKMLSPIVDELAKEMKGKVHFGKINIDKESDLAQRFEVMSIPALLFFKDGEHIDSTMGAMPKEELKKRINEVF